MRYFTPLAEQSMVKTTQSSIDTENAHDFAVTFAFEVYWAMKALCYMCIKKCATNTTANTHTHILETAIKRKRE